MLRVTLGCVPQTAPAVLPQVVAAGALLELSNVELLERVQEEVDENPALEAEVDCDRLFSGLKYRCPPEWGRAESGTQEWLQEMPRETSLKDHLCAQVLELDTPEEQDIAELIIEHIDDDGYLACPLPDIVEASRAPFHVVARVLKGVHRFDPVGCGAWTLQEALLIQLAELRERQAVPEHATEVIIAASNCRSPRRLIPTVAAELALSEAQVGAAMAFVRGNLAPYPGRAFRAPFVRERGQPRIVPVAAIVREGQGFAVEVPESQAVRARVAAAYERLHEAMACRRSGALSASEQETRALVSRARQFIRDLRQRANTVQRVTEAVVERQDEFVRSGPAFLKPLTRKQIAAETGLHESTISRTTRHKHLQMPDGELAAYSVFFDDALPTKALLRQFVATEDPERPWSDPELVGLLAARGIQLARRTVTKYREKMGVPPAAVRREEFRLRRPCSPEAAAG